MSVWIITHSGGSREFDGNAGQAVRYAIRRKFRNARITRC